MSTSHTTSPQRVNIAELIDNLNLTSYQKGVFLLCLLVTTIEGFDAQMIGLVGPAIAQMLHLSPKALGLVFSANFFGATIGAFTFGTLADRWGRKKMMIYCTLVFAVCTLSITQIKSVEQVAILRLVGGLGLGGSIPIAVALGTEYAATRIRATLASIMWVGVPLGSTIVGFTAAYVLPRYHWQTLFWIGGIVPLCIAIALIIALPESLSYLVRQGKDTSQVRRIVGKMMPEMRDKKAVEFYSPEKKQTGVPLAHLFTDGRALGTIMLWVLFYLSFAVLIFVTLWNPTLLRRSGATIGQASIAYSLWNAAAILATLCIGRVMDKFNYYWALAVIFVVSGIGVALFGIYANHAFLFVAFLSILSGIFVAGANSGLMALASLTYPPAIRGTGIGWAFAAGRCGAMTGPIVGGMCLSAGWSVGQVCIAFGLTGVLAAIVIFILRFSVNQQARRATAVAAVGAS